VSGEHFWLFLISSNNETILSRLSLFAVLTVSGLDFNISALIMSCKIPLLLILEIYGNISLIVSKSPEQIDIIKAVSIIVINTKVI
jgi:hypothetical protein